MIGFGAVYSEHFRHTNNFDNSFLTLSLRGCWFGLLVPLHPLLLIPLSFLLHCDLIVNASQRICLLFWLLRLFLRSDLKQFFLFFFRCNILVCQVGMLQFFSSWCNFRGLLLFNLITNLLRIAVCSTSIGFQTLCIP